MNPIIESALAQQVIALAEKGGKYKDNVLYSLSDKEFIENSAYSNQEAIQIIMQEGISPILIINYKDKICPLIEHVFSSSNDKAITDFFCSLLTPNHIKELPISSIQNLYYLNDEPDFVEKLFKLGFDFKQGSFEEVDKALYGDLNFFEACMAYKKDFKFSHKYDDNLTLDELLKEDIHYLKTQHPNTDIDKRESLLLFLKKARSIEELKDNLNNNLGQKASISTSLKI